MPQFDDGQPLAEQVRELVDGLGLTSRAWQTEALLINPPGLAPAALCVMAELHGRTEPSQPGTGTIYRARTRLCPYQSSIE
ncbi:MAG: hypothetical protein KBG20_13445 [Caldilineaceae bacterium]|nr:hypothetical protein [Caldilineaceae bacterium]MBP8123413.1 hypothetical protein [Caldilineaceae bacterium]MBP9073303.1 hypothetical protein [Caldilineaceae bacterium]